MTHSISLASSCLFAISLTMSASGGPRDTLVVEGRLLRSGETSDLWFEVDRVVEGSGAASPLLLRWPEGSALAAGVGLRLDLDREPDGAFRVERAAPGFRFAVPVAGAPPGLLAAPEPDRRADEASPRVGVGPTPEDQVVELVNVERAALSLPPLKNQSQLAAASEGHSTAMGERNFFAHCDVDTKKSPSRRASDAGYPGSAGWENIAAGYSSAAAVMNGWMNSSGHRANILRTSVHEIGVGYFVDTVDTNNVRRDQNRDCNADATTAGPYYRYWTQNFGISSFPVIIDGEAYQTESPNVELYIYLPPSATEMRFRNDGGGWSPWQPVASTRSWTLTRLDGVRTVYAELRNGSGSIVSTASDTIVAVGLGSELIFSDGFESGDLSAWQR